MTTKTTEYRTPVPGGSVAVARITTPDDRADKFELEICPDKADPVTMPIGEWFTLIATVDGLLEEAGYIQAKPEALN